MKESSYELLQVKKWRAITYDWEILASYGNTSRAYCLTDFQAAWLLSNIDYFAWSSRWENCPCTEQDMLALQGEMAYNLMNCVDIQPYQLQYLYDAGQTAELNHLSELWDATMTPSGVNPLTPDDYYSGDDSQDRIDALCTACKIYVYSYAQNWIQKAQIALGIVAVVGIAASITIVGGIIASVLVGGLAYVTSLALAAMQDEDALNDVACCMYNNLIGVAITNANFLTCLDGCGFTEGTNKAIVRDIVASDLTQFKNWLTFINQIGDSFVYAENGIIDCPCEPSTFTHVFDFTVSDGGFEARPQAMETIGAVYTASVGWVTTDEQWGTSDYRRSVSIKRLFDDREITSISFEYTYTKGTFSSGGATALSLREVLDSSTQAVVTKTADNMSNGSQEQELVATNDSDEITIFVSSSQRITNLYSGSVVITSCTVNGNGSDPFV